MANKVVWKDKTWDKKYNWLDFGTVLRSPAHDMHVLFFISGPRDSKSGPRLRKSGPRENYLGAPIYYLGAPTS